MRVRLRQSSIRRDSPWKTSLPTPIFHPAWALSFTTEELKSYLNGVFKDQANVEITDVIDDGLIDATDLPSAGKPNGDGALCINNGEAVPLIAELNDNAGHRAIFIFTQRYAWSRQNTKCR